MKLNLNLLLSLACILIALSESYAQCDFTASPQASCNPLTIDFEVIMPFGNTYEWEFGDGETSNGASVTHTYASEGNYTITLLQDSLVCVEGFRISWIKIKYFLTCVFFATQYHNAYYN